MQSDSVATPDRPVTFFISYSPADERWAAWIAGTLEQAGYRTVFQAWDFVAGMNFIDSMDRGLTGSVAVVAVLSGHYAASRYGRMEWQAALRADPDRPDRRLLTVRVDEAPVEGLLAMITYVDLVGVTDANAARAMLLTRIEQALDGHARPDSAPPFPGSGHDPAVLTDAAPSDAASSAVGRRAGRGPLLTVPPYPLALPARPRRNAVTVLQLAGPEFGRGLDPEELLREIQGDLIELQDSGAPPPDLAVVTGDLTASGSPRACEQSLAFLNGLRAQLNLPAGSVLVVPGNQDVNHAASQAYFHTCTADEESPRPPYWPKWRHFSRMFREFYQGVDAVFDSDQPWTLLPLPELATVVAGFNSSIACTHRPEDQFGKLGRAQAAWFAEVLRDYEKEGWLRIGVVRHPLVAGVPAAENGGPGLLQDVDVFQRLLAPRLHMLLHGPSGGPGSTGGRPDHQMLPCASGQLPAFGAAGPARFTVLRVGAAGVERWTPRSDGEPTLFPVQWRSAPRLPQEADDTEPPSPTASLLHNRAVTDPAEELAERVKEVLRARQSGVRLRDVQRTAPGDLVQVFAAWDEEGVVRLQRIAVHPGTPGAADLDHFMAQAHADDAAAEAELVFNGLPPERSLRERAARGGVRMRSFPELQGLLDLREYVAAQTAALDSDKAYAPSLYLPQRFRDELHPGSEEKDDLVEEMLRQLATDQGRVVLLLGNFGHGKTFALRQLARLIPLRLPHLVPLLIPLRSLDRSHSLHGLVASHLANHDVDMIDLRALRYMLAQGRVVLLFDGFDELVNRVSYERAAEHLHTLLDAAVDRAKIVISGRTQHFRSTEQVLTPLGERVELLAQRRLFSVQGFIPDQILRFLVNLYGDEEDAVRRFHLLERVPQLLALCANPRLLSFVAALDENHLRAVAESGRALSAAKLYEDVFTGWLSYEERRGQGGPGAAPGLDLEAMWAVVTAIALRLWESGQSSLRLDELTDIVTRTFGRWDAGDLFSQQTQAVGAGTMLVRVDDGIFHFIHESVIEWLVAREAARRLGQRDETVLGLRQLSPLAIEFFCDLADQDLSSAWARRIVENPGDDLSQAARANAFHVKERLRVPADADLRGVRLPGEDLSGRDLSGLDLTGANLADSQLTGANLAGAVLRDARLSGARLDGADLHGCDLGGADMRRARLIGANLRGATVAGGNWRRAVVIGTRLDEPARSSPELATATIAPDLPLETALRPAVLSVPYGFDTRTGRLPEPIAYSPDGELLAVGSEDGSVLVCAPENGEALRTLHGHLDRVYAVKFRAAVLATGSADGTVRLWDPVSGRCLSVLHVHPRGVWPVALDDAGDLLATGDSDGLVRIWNTATGTPLHDLAGHIAPTYSAVFSPDGRTLATGDSGGTVRLWDTATGTLRHALSGHHGAVYRVRFSPDGTLLATADQGVDDHGVVRIWETAGADLLHVLTGHTGKVYTLDFHPGGDLLASGDTSGQVRLWDPRTGLAGQPLEQGSGPVYQVVFRSNGRQLAACDSDGSVRLWQITEGRDWHEASPAHLQPPSHQGSAWACRFRRDDSQMVTAGADGVVQIWDAETGQGKPILRGHGRRINAVAFDASGLRLASCGSDGVVRLWDTRSGRHLNALEGQGDRLVSAVFSGSGPYLATAGSSGKVYLRNTEAEGPPRELDVETDHTWAEAFSPDGNTLATANDDDTVRLWWRSSGSGFAELSGHRGRVRSIAFSADGRLLATGCDDCRVRVWLAQGGQPVSEMLAHDDRVYGVAFGADGAWLGSASWDGTAIIWRGGAPRHVLRGHRGKLWSAAAHPSLPLLATAGDDHTIRLWDVDSGAERMLLSGHHGRIYSVAFSPDGTLLASGSDDGTVRLWRLEAAFGAFPREVSVALKATMIGTSTGWATLTPEGGYKSEGDVEGEFWHVVGMARFLPGELDGHLPGGRRLALDAAL
ncbi:TIR domain-containing protein [Streptomyces sp. IBSBF 2435]|uniref:WD40 domain-containing protein n=1 Tax=Streptomyces sp. IBSBF 2435 TaxID=2903531 RepID=UPI002FDBF8E2